MNTIDCGGYTKVAVLPNGRCRHYYSQYIKRDINVDELVYLLSGVGCELSVIDEYDGFSEFSVEYRGEYLGVLILNT